MSGQMVTQGEGLLTHSAFKRPLPSMYVHVRLQRVLGPKGTSAGQAHMGPDPLVALLVSRQRRLVLERLVTEAAVQEYSRCHVHAAFVGRHVFPCSESLAAEVTLVGPFTPVFWKVVLERILRRKGAWALLALEGPFQRVLPSVHDKPGLFIECQWTELALVSTTVRMHSHFVLVHLVVS